MRSDFSNFIKAAFVAASLFALAGCAGNPLVGEWFVEQNSPQGGNVRLVLALNADGTAVTRIEPTGGTINGVTITCTGALSNSGYRWTSTATTISVTGTPMCSGMVTCMAQGMSSTSDCSSGLSGGMGSSDPLRDAMYTLSNNNNTLTITTMSNGMTSMTAFTRRM